MVLCPYCNGFRETARCEVDGCGGFVCGQCNQCNRRERFHPADETTDDALNGIVSPSVAGSPG
jgi:hypothetical protein